MSKIPKAGSKATVLMAISNGPSFNYTSHKKDAIAGYTLYAFIDNAEATAEHTFFNGQPAYLLDQTTHPKCFGGAAGRGGGVRSGTIGGEVKPTSGSSTIFIEGKALIREGDTCTMNNGNVEGMYVTVDAAQAEQIMAQWADQATKDALADGGLLAGPSTGNSKLDTSKFYLGGDKDLQKAFDEIISTPHGRYIVSVIQNDDKIIGVTLEKGNGIFGKTIPRMEAEIISEPEWWELWKSTERVDKVIMDVRINMQNEDPYFVRADGKGLYRPNLTEVLAHELAHIKNYVTHGKLFYKNQSIVHQNTIMRQLDKNSIARHPSKEHGGSFGN